MKPTFLKVYSLKTTLEELSIEIETSFFSSSEAKATTIKSFVILALKSTLSSLIKIVSIASEKNMVIPLPFSNWKLFNNVETFPVLLLFKTSFKTLERVPFFLLFIYS